MALHIKPDGTITVVEPQTKKGFSLQELQSFVGGYIEYCPIHKGWRGTEIHLEDGTSFKITGRHEMVCNEEGLLESLPFNRKATMLAGPGAFIVGDVLITTGRK